MAKQRRSRCDRCGRPDSEVRISKRGLCFDCGLQRSIQVQQQLRAKSGPEYDAWLKAWQDAAGQMGRPETPYTPGV